MSQVVVALQDSAKDICQNCQDVLLGQVSSQNEVPMVVVHMPQAVSSTAQEITISLEKAVVLLKSTGGTIAIISSLDIAKNGIKNYAGKSFAHGFMKTGAIVGGIAVAALAGYGLRMVVEKLSRPNRNPDKEKGC